MIRTLAAVLISLGLPSLASATLFTYQATLSGANELPANASPATGTATVSYDDAAHTLAVSASFSGLQGLVTAAHIHCCVSPPNNVGVASPTPTFPGFPASVTSGTYAQTFDLTQSSSWNGSFVAAQGGTVGGAEAALASGLAGGMAYFNVHTSSFGGGEIRGFFVPEPSTSLLVGGGIALLARRRHRSV